MTGTGTVLPQDPWFVHAAHIESVTFEAPQVFTWHIRLDDAERHESFRARPGQFNMLYLPGLGESAISISGACGDGAVIPHTVRTAGTVTQALARLHPGDSLGIRGPFGSCWPMDCCEDHDVILVAGGIGLAPLRPVIHHILNERHRFRSVTLLCGSRAPAGLLYQGEYAEWRAGGLTVEATVDRTDDHWTGHVGVVTLLLERVPLPDARRTILLTCGPEVMMWYTIQTALRRGLTKDSLWVSLERNMNCATGLCGHCQFGPHFICKDGPVIRFDRVESILRLDDF